MVLGAFRALLLDRLNVRLLECSGPDSRADVPFESLESLPLGNFSLSVPRRVQLPGSLGFFGVLGCLGDCAKSNKCNYPSQLPYSVVAHKAVKVIVSKQL